MMNYHYELNQKHYHVTEPESQPAHQVIKHTFSMMVLDYSKLNHKLLIQK